MVTLMEEVAWFTCLSRSCSQAVFLKRLCMIDLSNTLGKQVQYMVEFGLSYLGRCLASRSHHFPALTFSFKVIETNMMQICSLGSFTSKSALLMAGNAQILDATEDEYQWCPDQRVLFYAWILETSVNWPIRDLPKPFSEWEIKRSRPSLPDF